MRSRPSAKTRKRAADALAELDRFPQIPPRPGAELDPVLDTVERCLTRYGLRRTSMTDIARELGVARTTLYRQVSSIEDAIALVAARQLYVFLDELIALLTQGAGPQTFIDAAFRTITFVRSSPLALRVLNDEPELIGALVTDGRLPDYVNQVVELVAPVFDAAMVTGAIRTADPRLTAAFIVRLIGVFILVPADDDLEALLRLALEPILQPDRSRPRAPASRSV